MDIKEKYYLFGSENSLDYDILVLVQNIPYISTAKEWCQDYKDKFAKIYKDKLININLGVLEQGRVVRVFKGTPDEVNNSIYLTYQFHQQQYPLEITGLTERILPLKLARVARIILTFLSRVERNIVKKGLHGNMQDKLAALSAIDFAKLKDLGDKKCTIVEFAKTCAFQFGQAIALFSEKQLYTKNEIKKEYADLANYLDRIPVSLEIIEEYKQKFIDICRKIPDNSYNKWER